MKNSIIKKNPRYTEMKIIFKLINTNILKRKKNAFGHIT